MITCATTDPSISNLHATHQYYRLTGGEASRIEAQVRAAVSRWRRVATAAAVSASEQRLLGDIIEPDAD
jgi:hypothetical protein